MIEKLTVPPEKNQSEKQIIDYLKRKMNEYHVFVLDIGQKSQLTEAIMCGCIPIVSNVPSMADCVPEKNVLRKPILSELVFIIESGLKYDPNTEKKVRENTLERRRNQLIKVIQ